jgi:hypothetical protein
LLTESLIFDATGMAHLSMGILVAQSDPFFGTLSSTFLLENKVRRRILRKKGVSGDFP